MKGLAEFKLKPIFVDICVFVSKDRSFIVGLYVNDMLIFINNITVVYEFKKVIIKRWEIKDLSKVKKILGFEVICNR